MSTVLGSRTESRDNNFNLLRFLAATLVIFSHSYVLTGDKFAEPLRRLTGMTFGDVAVDVFFVTSGFLVTRSLFHRKETMAFIWARILRIYPGLIIAVLFSVFVVGVGYTTMPIAAFLRSTEVHRFIFTNVTLLERSFEYSLPHTFTNNPFPNAVNGSLWTLPWEIRMYLILATLSLMGTARLRGMLVGIGAVSLMSFLILPYVPFHVQGRIFLALRFISLFFMGAAFYVLRHCIRLHAGVFGGMLALILCAAAFREKVLFADAFYLFGPYMVLYLAYVPSGRVRHFNRFGDYSYGLYIYAFAVQQALASTFPKIGVLPMFGAAFGITFALAALSWNIIEAPALALKSKFRQRQQGVDRSTSTS